VLDVIRSVALLSVFLTVLSFKAPAAAWAASEGAALSRQRPKQSRPSVNQGRI
jgi:hypothetical protein